MSRRQSTRKPIPKLSHEQAIEQLVEYEFGRLSPVMNAAVEAHVRSCPICQRQGLNHAATEKRHIERSIRHMKPARRRLSKRGRYLILILMFVIIAQVAVVEISRGGLLGNNNPASPGVTPSPSQATATPQSLTPSATLTQSSAGGAVALAPDGKSVAGIVTQGGVSSVGVWNAKTGSLTATFAWPGSSAPGEFSWSPDGSLLAAADGSSIGVWTVKTQAQLWMDTLPGYGNIRIYDSQSGSAVQRPDATVFANGGLINWGTGGASPSVVASATPVVTGPTSAEVGLWDSAGTHLFIGANGAVFVGYASSDAAAHHALLTWSPDGRLLLWAATSEPVSLPSSSTATPGGASGVTSPDPLITAEVGKLAQSGKGDALEWFSPDGKLLAQCDRSTSSTVDLNIWNRATGQPVFVVSGGCAKVTQASLGWSAIGDTFALDLPNKPIAVYDATTSK